MLKHQIEFCTRPNIRRQFMFLLKNINYLLFIKAILSITYKKFKYLINNIILL